MRRGVWKSGSCCRLTNEVPGDRGESEPAEKAPQTLEEYAVRFTGSKGFLHANQRGQHPLDFLTSNHSPGIRELPSQKASGASTSTTIFPTGLFSAYKVNPENQEEFTEPSVSDDGPVTHMPDGRARWILGSAKPGGKGAQPRVTTLFPTALKTEQSQPVSSRDLKQSKVYPATEGGCHLFLPPTNRHQTYGVGVCRETQRPTYWLEGFLWLELVSRDANQSHKPDGVGEGA
ncbi:uncharacterized protein LOC111827100 [Myotis lucifugus]|uniref:uncharacterized protein LOC111827100 n=1 Tax=Myotis lucifugus TaxID=59463 RepID=UPI000CCBEC40|nr:uncharacterized protein LOC111827100 [Myotis lucifugus]